MCAFAYQGGGDAHEAEEGGRGRALRLHHDGEHLKGGELRVCVLELQCGSEMLRSVRSERCKENAGGKAVGDIVERVSGRKGVAESKRDAFRL